MKNIILVFIFLLGSLLPSHIFAQELKNRGFKKNLGEKVMRVALYSQYEKDLLEAIWDGDAVTFKKTYEEALANDVQFSSKTRANFLETLLKLDKPNKGVLKTLCLVLTREDIVETFNAAVLFDRPIKDDELRDFFVLSILDKVGKNPDNLRVNLPKNEVGGRASLLAYWAYRYSFDMYRNAPDARYKLVQLLVENGANIKETMFIEDMTLDIEGLIDFYSDDGEFKTVNRMAKELVGLPVY